MEYPEVASLWFDNSVGSCHCMVNLHTTTVLPQCSPLQTPRNWVLAELATVCECYICQQRAELVCATSLPSTDRLIIYFASGAVAVDSSHMTASSSTLWCRFSPPSNFVNGHVSTMWFMVCCWLLSQEGDWERPHLCKLARHGP